MVVAYMTFLQKIWLWYAVEILKFRHVIIKTDESEKYIIGFTFSNDGTYAEYIHSLSKSDWRTHNIQ